MAFTGKTGLQPDEEILSGLEIFIKNSVSKNLL